MYPACNKILFESLSGYSMDRHVRQRFDAMVVIPAFAEEEVLKMIQSVSQSTCAISDVGLLVLINEGESVESGDEEVNEKCFVRIAKYISEREKDTIQVMCLYVKRIPDKWAGVGMARKIAMDQAYLLLKDSACPIINLDADCTVSGGYVDEVVAYFLAQPKIDCVNIHFEHEWSMEKHPEYIIQYETHLRYFISMQRRLSLPYAYHTVGSSFAVRGNAYLQVGGMNKRKAGEDFYFIHKFIKKGTLGELGTAIVFPSARISDRVPFGTGRAMGSIKQNGETWLTYNPQSFVALKSFLDCLPQLYSSSQKDDVVRNAVDAQVLIFLDQIDAFNKIHRIRANVTNYERFLKAVFQWFDAFVLMKYLHHMRDAVYPNIPVSEALDIIRVWDGDQQNKTLSDHLFEMRQKDKISCYQGIKDSLNAYPLDRSKD